MPEASVLAISQGSIAREMESFDAKRENLTEQFRVVNQDIESCNSRLSNVTEGLSRVYVSDVASVVGNFERYLEGFGVNVHELLEAIRVSEVDDKMMELQLPTLDLSKFGEIKGKEYNFGLFKLSGFNKRQNLGNREFALGNIVEYLDARNTLADLEARKASMESGLNDPTSSYDKNMGDLESKFLGYVALNHLEKIAESRGIESLSSWLEGAEASQLCLDGYNMIRRESDLGHLADWENAADEADKVGGVGEARGADKSRVPGADYIQQTPSLKRRELLDLKQNLLSRMGPATIARFFEENRGDVGAGDKVIIRSGVLQCGSFHLHLSGEKAGKWYRFSGGEGGDIYKLAGYLGISEKASVGHQARESEFNNFKAVARFVGANLDMIHNESSDLDNRLDNHLNHNAYYTLVAKEISNIQTEDMARLGSQYVAAYKDSWQSLQVVADGASPFDPQRDTPFLIGIKVRASNSAVTDVGNVKYAIYDYKDARGNLVGHVLRSEGNKIAESSNDAAGVKKAVYPISYSKNLETGEFAWRVKGFAAGNLIYGAESLEVNDKNGSSVKPVLIVEGEKTCEAAKELVGQEYVVISWSGGSSAAGKVDWSLLAGRDIVIWPDADSAGVKAAGLIEGSLGENNVDVKSLNIIDVRSLGLSDGWDMADNLPSHLKKFSIKDIIADSSSAIDHSRALLREKIGAIEFGRDFSVTNSGKIGVLQDIASRNLQKAGLWSAKYQERLTHELSVVEKSGSADEFILASNVVKYCKAHDIAVGVGRGSAVGSLTAYALGIHCVDPIKYDLSFERFLSEGKSTIPDFDIDVSSRDREKVIDYLFQAFGERVALMATTHDKRHPSGVVVLPDGIDREEAVSRGLCSFTLVNPSGYPIMKNAGSFKDLEKLGFRKIDILSSHMLDKIRDTIDSVNKKFGSSVDFAEVEKYAMSDKETYSLIARGDTLGIYQLESLAAQKICRQVAPEKFADVLNILALNRPGTQEFVNLFDSRENDEGINRESERGNNNFKIFDPQGVLRETRGAILFQEQVMEAGVKYFGVQEKDADAFRRDLEKDPGDRIAGDKDACIKQATALDKNLTEDQAESLYASLEKFAKFGYNKSHAVAYSKVTIVSAYLKVHYSQEFSKHFGIEKDKALDKTSDKPGSSSVGIKEVDRSHQTRVHKYLYGRIAEYMKEEGVSDRYVREFITERMTYSSREELGYSKEPVYNKDMTISKKAFSILLDELDKEKIPRNRIAHYVKAELLIDSSRKKEASREVGHEDISKNVPHRNPDIDLDILVRDKIAFAVSSVSFEAEEKVIAAGKRGEDLIFNDVFEERADYSARASDNLSIEHDASMIAKISAMKSAERGAKLTFDEREKIHMLYDSRDEKIQFEMESHRRIRSFAEESGELAAKYLAGQVVDYKMQHGAAESVWNGEPHLSSRRFEIMKNVANEQALLEHQMNSRFSASGAGGTNNADTGKENIEGKHKPSDEVLTKSIIAQDKICAIRLATHRLCENMTMKIHEVGLEKLDVASCQMMRNAEVLKVEKELHLSQRAYAIDRTRELQENKERELSRGHDGGMGM